MNQDDLHVLRVNVLKVARAAADKIIDFTGNFHTAISTAYHNEGEMPPPPLRVGANLSFFHFLHDVGAQGYGVTDVLERKGMVSHAGHNMKIGHIATRNN